jgi:hypothetical protein
MPPGQKEFTFATRQVARRIERPRKSAELTSQGVVEKAFLWSLFLGKERVFPVIFRGPNGVRLSGSQTGYKLPGVQGKFILGVRSGVRTGRMSDILRDGLARPKGWTELKVAEYGK